MPSSCGSRRVGQYILAVTTASLVFGWAQNTFHPVGGSISVAKILWLNLTLLIFYVVPFWLWREPALDARLRSLFGLVLASFAIRAPIELYIIYRTRLWRCEYGLAHDLFTLLLVTWFAWRRPVIGETRDRNSGGAFIALLQLTLLVEMFMAWEFRKVASPAAGIYFAAPTAEFNVVNRASWIAVAILYPALAWLIFKPNRHETA